MSKSGSAHSTPYPVAIFQARSLMAMRSTIPLSLSAFPTPVFWPISVARADISSPSVDGIMTVRISTVYFFRISAILASSAVFSVAPRTCAVSITEEFKGQSVQISKACTVGETRRRMERSIFFITIVRLWYNRNLQYCTIMGIKSDFFSSLKIRSFRFVGNQVINSINLHFPIGTDTFESERFADMGIKSGF